MGVSVFIGGCIGFFISRCFWDKISAEEKSQTAAFYKKMERKVDFQHEVGEENDAFQLIQIGRFATIMGIGILFLLIPMDTPAARWVVLSISGFIGGIGLFMMISGKMRERRTKQ